MGNGVLSVITAGAPVMPGWFVDNWDTPVVQHMEVLCMVQALDRYGLII